MIIVIIILSHQCIMSSIDMAIVGATLYDAHLIIGNPRTLVLQACISILVQHRIARPGLRPLLALYCFAAKYMGAVT